MNLDELEAKARAAKEATARFVAGEPSDDVDDANLAFCAAASPDTILYLIERVRAGDRIRTFVNRSHGTAEFKAALDDFDRLARSPQEAV